MIEARTVWHELETRRAGAPSKHRTGLLLAVILLVTMTVAEVQFLRYVAGPDSVNLMAAAEGIPTIE
jgi:hypothetical protein